MLQKFEEMTASRKLPWKIVDVLPQVLVAGEQAGTLTEKGADLIDNLFPVGIPFAPPEGDAGTGMTATNAVAPRTGNVSAGTSIFAMVVLEEMLATVYEEIDMVTTPSEKPVAITVPVTLMLGFLCCQKQRIYLVQSRTYQSYTPSCIRKR